MQEVGSAGTIAVARRPEHRGRSLYTQALFRLLTQKPMGVLGLAIVVVLVVAAIGAPWMAPADPNALASGAKLEGPSLSHPFGTDNLGRDVFSRVVFGARISMTIGLVAVITSTVISVAIGVLSGFFGGVVDLLFQRLIDALIAFPGLVLILAMVAIFADTDLPGLPEEGAISTPTVVLMGTIGFLLGVGGSRIIRSAVLSVRASTYVEAAQSLGAGDLRLMRTHILPNVLPPTITLATLGLGTAILLEATLSFLGLGVPPNIATWGGMLNREARSWMTEAPWLALFPGLALSLAVFGFNMLGDALRDVLDPRLRT
ncbi:MAG: ABC transporter permease subunit [Dehalococcoidia bacterium]|nr:ABC transporter permease subunit [Dehalococcoidia bacterium]